MAPPPALALQTVRFPDTPGGPRLSDLGELCRHPVAREPVRRLVGMLLESWGDRPLDRVYLGSAFCERLLPSVRRFSRALEACEERGLTVTFVTPFGGDSLIDKLERLLPLLAPGTEVVFNDLGVLWMLRERFSELTPVQGRLLAKGLRDPRFTPHLRGQARTVEEGAAVTDPGIASGSLRELLRRFGVQAAECDLLPQGTLLAGGNGLAVHLHAPFAVVSSGRICSAAAQAAASGRPIHGGARCQRNCEDHAVVYRYPGIEGAEGEVQVIQKGNTHFHAAGEEIVRDLLRGATRGLIDRVVLSPDLPLSCDAVSVDGGRAP